MAEGLEAWTIIDIRTDDKYGHDANGLWQKAPNGTPDYEDGHITGATIVPLQDIATYAAANLSKDQKLLVVCYTGHKAGHAVLVLNLLGYDAWSLGFGMSAWSKELDLWSGKISSDFGDSFTKDADTGKGAEGDLPALDTGETEGAAILDARIADLLAGEGRFITSDILLGALDDYYIVNYWPEAEYLDPGHITGSHQYTPKTDLRSDAFLNTLPTDKMIAVYCYSGQHGSQVAAWLTIMGYDAYDLKLGTNGLIHDQMTHHKWPGAENGPQGYDVEWAAVEVDEAGALVEYLEGDLGDYLNTTAPKVVGASDVMADGLEVWTIIDVRSADKYGEDESGTWKMEPNGKADYEDGHIAGAAYVEMGDLLTYADDNLGADDKILVVCHTGQLAGHAVLVLNLLGYDAFSLKWGMSGWNTKYDLWTGNTSSDYTGSFATDADTGKNAAGDYPTLSTGAANEAAILRARLEDLVSKPGRFVTIAGVVAALDDYYIVNYWPEAEYLDPGHITGSHQYTPKTDLRSDAFLNTLPTDKMIAVYCYSGQHGSQVAAYLTLLGYDAYDVKFGTNGMIYDQMTHHKWPGAENGPAGFDTVTD